VQKFDAFNPVTFQSKVDRCRKASLLCNLVILFLLLFLYVIPHCSEQQGPVRVEGLQGMILGSCHSQRDAPILNGTI